MEMKAEKQIKYYEAAISRLMEVPEPESTQGFIKLNRALFHCRISLCQAYTRAWPIGKAEKEITRDEN